MVYRAFGLACGLGLAILTVLPARAEDNKIFPAEATIPNSRVIHFTSTIDKEPYEIQVSIPWWPAPKEGYPVIYVLDGELYFPEAAIASDLLGGAGAVVVGIGHDALNNKNVAGQYAPRRSDKPAASGGNDPMDAFNFLRDHDFRWPARPEHRAPPALAEGTGPESSNDVDAFLQVIEEEIKPRVEKLVSIDRTNQALFGHSGGGLAVVRALFTEPSAFHTFIAASPALWYDGAAIFNGEKYFAGQVNSGRVAPHILITVGALEPSKDVIANAMFAGLKPADRASALTYEKMWRTWPGMIPGARDLAARLNTLHGKPGYKVDFQMIAGEDHQGSAFVAVVRAIKFAFSGKE